MNTVCNLIITNEMVKHAQKAGACKKEIAKARRLIGEKLTNPYWAYWYAKEVIKGRWPEAEGVIARDAAASYMYARHVLGGTWPEAEAVIARDPVAAYLYAQKVLGGPFHAGEPVIARAPWCAYFYARDVLRGPFPAGEPAIKKGMWGEDYEKLISGRR